MFLFLFHHLLKICFSRANFKFFNMSWWSCGVHLNNLRLKKYLIDVLLIHKSVCLFRHSDQTQFSFRFVQILLSTETGKNANKQ